MKFVPYPTLSLWAAVSCAVSLAVGAAPAQAQQTRTWVSGAGNDANPCTRALPCLSFIEAHSKTNDGGQINCLDGGSFGPVIITKAITIDCTGTLGGVLNPMMTAVVINAGAGKAVKLRGLSINGSISFVAAQTGIQIQSAGSVTIENVFIENQRERAGIEIAPSTGTLVVNILNTVLTDNSSGPGAGIQVVPSGTALVRITMRNVQVLGTTGNAVRLDSTGTAGLGILAIIENCNFSNSSGAGISAVAGSNASPFNVTLLTNSNISNNGGAGISTSGAAARVRVGNTSLSLNGTGISPGTGFINNLGGNFVVGNSTEGAFN